MSEAHVPTFVPGDEIVYVVRFNYPANVRSVTAVFRNETTGTEIVLSGLPDPMRHARRGTRQHIVRMSYDYERQENSEPEPGRYRLVHIEAITYKERLLAFDNPPEDGFLFENEPDDATLPRLDRVQMPTGEVTRATWFELPASHSDKLNFGQ
jgi:hypothetical protein